MDAANLGMACSIDPLNQSANILLTFEDGDGLMLAWTSLPPEAAARIGMALLAQAHEAQLVQNEIDGTPMDDRAATVDKIVARLGAQAN